MYFQNVSPIRSETVALSVHAQRTVPTCSTLDSSPYLLATPMQLLAEMHFASR